MQQDKVCEKANTFESMFVFPVCLYILDYFVKIIFFNIFQFFVGFIP